MPKYRQGSLALFSTFDRSQVSHAASRGDVSTMKSYLETDKSIVNELDYDKRAPLHIAAKNGHFELCKLLVDHGADVNLEDRFNHTPLDEALLSGNENLFSFLKSAALSSF